VDKGVLQGDIGAKVMGDVYERSQELLSEGVAGIESQKMAQIIQLGESQKARQLQLQQMLMSGQISREQLAQGWTGQAMGMAGGQQAMAQNFAQAATQFSAGLMQDWETQKINAGLSAWGQMSGERGRQAQGALQAAIANAQASASETASKWGAFGNIAGMATYGALI
jgi:hypothetical protein